jgi:long-chain acyl-CoA synthetase
MIDISRTFDILSYNEKHQPLDKALSIKRNGQWESFSTKEYRQKVNQISYALMEMGFKKGDKIATVISNAPEWNFIDFGISQLGAVHVGIYPTISVIEYEHILSHSEAKLLIVSSKELFDKINPIAQKTESIREVISIEKIGGVKNYEDLLKVGASLAEKYQSELADRMAAVQPEDILTLIYTSGTTGLSKGVMLTHKNVVSNVLLGWEFTTYLNPGERAFSFLPMSHVLERSGNYLWQSLGLEIYYAGSIESIVPDMKEAKPHVFISVPRIFEKVYDKIINTGREQSFIKKNIFFWAVKLADEYCADPSKRSWYYNFRHKIADKLIFSKWREALGGCVKGSVSGGAALQPRLARAFWAANIKVQEGYGLTETSPITTANGFEFPKVRFGAVGYINTSVQVKIAEDGEVLIKGDNVMKGYYKDEEKTKEVLKNGWFHSGDIGKIEDGFLFITDRKKEIFKLSGGKYVAPQVIENVLKESNFVEQVMVVGENQRFTAALIAPDFVFLSKWAEIHQVSFKSNKDLIENQKVIDRIGKEVDKYNEQLDQISKIKEFRLVCDSWTPESGDLSPTLKLKRRSLLAKYKHKIEDIYQAS